MPRSLANLSTNAVSTISALQEGDTAGFQAIVARMSEALYLVCVLRRVELKDPGLVHRSGRQGKGLCRVACIHQQQQAPSQVVPLTEPNTQGTQVRVVPLALLHLGAAYTQPRHILDA